jgi:hypothetical protein
MSDNPSNQQRQNPDEQRQAQLRALMQAAIQGPIPHFYANGIGMGQTATDITIIFLNNNAPTHTVAMSYGLAKFIVGELSKGLKNYETATRRKIADLNIINSELQKILGQTNAL